MRQIALFLLLLVVALSATAQPSAPPQFFIERIDVRNADRVSPDVVIFESRLRTGHTYNEQELREASDRVNRLPYLLSADFSLEKGTDRGKYVLVITLNETRVFFFGLHGIGYVPQDNVTDIDYTAGQPTAENDLAVGWRFFVGSRGAVHFGLQGATDNRDYTTDYTSLAVGYTQYDIFGTRAFATLNLGYPIDEGSHSLAPELVLGMPVTAKQTVTASYDQLAVAADKAYTIYLVGGPPQKLTYNRQTAQRRLKATWSYNTTNNPVIPSKGVLLTVSPVAVWLDRTYLSYRRADPPQYYATVVATSHEHSLGVDATARQYWELSDRNSVSAGLEAGWARTHGTLQQAPISFRESYVAALASAAHSFWSRERVAKDGDQSIEGFLWLRTKSGRHDLSDVRPYGYSVATGQASVAWVRRNAWGAWRLGLGYAW